MKTKETQKQAEDRLQNAMSAMRLAVDAKDAEFLDRCAIAAMQAIIASMDDLTAQGIEQTDKSARSNKIERWVAERAYTYAATMLVERDDR